MPSLTTFLRMCNPSRRNASKKKTPTPTKKSQTRRKKSNAYYRSMAFYEARLADTGSNRCPAGDRQRRHGTGGRFVGACIGFLRTPVSAADTPHRGQQGRQLHRRHGG